MSQQSADEPIIDNRCLLEDCNSTNSFACIGSFGWNRGSRCSPSSVIRLTILNSLSFVIAVPVKFKTPVDPAPNFLLPQQLAERMPPAGTAARKPSYACAREETP